MWLRRFGRKTLLKLYKAHDTDAHPKGEALPMQQRVYRVKVVTSYLQAGISLNKLEHL